MEIICKPMGVYQTNCYIISFNNKDLIIDPGVESFSWIKENAKNPIAILNTHGHFDHIWSNSQVKEFFNIPIYCPKDDIFMLENDPFAQGTPKSKVDFIIEHDETINLNSLDIKFHHFPGHTPGCSAIQINNSLFSGDFIFKGSIGRVDFPYSNAQDMKNSLNKIINWKEDFIIYPGHGNQTTLNNEKNSLKSWINYI